MRKTLQWSVALALLLTLALPGTALAHVEVSPDEVPPGGVRTFVFNVVTEKDVPTTRIDVEVPEGFEVVEARSPGGGWRGVVEDGSVSWSGGEIGVGGPEFTAPSGDVVTVGEAQEFTLETRVPEEPGAYPWPTTQTYRDGSTVEWAGARDSSRPAPVVEVAASGVTTATGEGGETHASGDGHHGSGEAASDDPGADGQETPGPEGRGPISPYAVAGIGVLAASAATGGLVLLRRRS